MFCLLFDLYAKKADDLRKDCSLFGNKGITDKSVPAMKEMLRSSNITQMRKE
jgi:hypothetical protein